MIFPIESKSNERLSIDDTRGKKLSDLGFVEEKLAWSVRLMLRMAGAIVRLDIGIVQKYFAVFDPGERVIEIGKSGSDRFDFGALQFDPSLDLVKDMVIVKRTPVGDDLNGHR
jgi:hypothetical protein